MICTTESDRFDLFSHILTEIIWNEFHVHQTTALWLHNLDQLSLLRLIYIMLSNLAQSVQKYPQD